MVNIIPHEIDKNTKYIIHPDHRNNTRDKSQWTISPDVEIGVFTYSLNNSWLIKQDGWGLYLNGNTVLILGHSSDNQRSLFIARFIDSTNKQEWHGYPADHVRRNSDIPAVELLQTWMTNGYLRPAKVSKIVRGKPCNL